MNSAWLTWSAAPCLALALFACQRDNPAFDPDVGGSEGGSEGNGEASTTQTSTTQTSTTQTSTTQTSAGDGDGDGDPGDGDGDGTPGDGDGDGDGDPTMDGPIDTGMIKLDMPVGECLVPTHEGLFPRFGAPNQFNGSCLPEVGMHVRVGASFGSHWLANPCLNGCGGFCDPQKQYVIGADGLQIGLAMLIAPVVFNPNTPWIGCYYVEAVGLVSEGEDACVYASLSVHTDEGPTSPLLFNANRDSWGLTPGAALHYGEWTPQIIDTQMACACDELEIDCCMGSTVKAKQFSLGDPVSPGEIGNVVLGQSAFTFYAAQAQSGTNCEIDPETSWALWAE